MTIVDDSSLAKAGEQAWSQALAKSNVSRTKAANARVRAVGQRVVEAAGLGQRPGTTRCSRTPPPTPSSCRAAMSGVTTGLLNLVDNDDQLAAVIGHEAGHVVARHAAERQSQNLTSSLVLGVLGAGRRLVRRGPGDLQLWRRRGQVRLPAAVLAQAGTGGRPPGRRLHAAGRLPPARGGDPVAAHAGPRRRQHPAVRLDPPVGRRPDLQAYITQRGW
jgi:hypothetical protein